MRDHGMHGIEHGLAWFAVPLLTGLLLAFMLLGVAVLLWRRSRLAQVLGRSSTSPELDARRTLADRFARGDIDGEEFMERASLLNWTPGLPDPARPVRR